MSKQKFQVRLDKFQALSNLILKKRILIKFKNINDSQESKDEITQSEIQISKLQQIGNLNLQIQQFNLYHNICKETLNQYESMTQTMERLSNYFEKEQLQQFNQLKMNFERDSFLMSKTIKYDQIEKELIDSKKQTQVLQNEITESEKKNQKNLLLINNLNLHDAEQALLIENLTHHNKELSSSFKLINEQKTKCEAQLKEKLIQLQLSQQSNQKNEELLKQLQLTMQELQFTQSLTFSTTHKQSSCTVTQNGKVIENSSEGVYCCMSDQMIPKNGLILFAFKIFEINDKVIGIGFRDIVYSKSYIDCYPIGGGIDVIILTHQNRTYNIQYQGYCRNLDQADKDQKQIAFSFTTNDFIIIEVDILKKYVKWTKQSTNQSFTLIIDTSKDLYPCVYLSGKCKVEILNQIIK